MAKNIRSGGVDFDDLFDPDVMGDGPSATFLKSGGVPLKYAALSYGTKRADVGYRDSADVDVSNLWAAKGTALYSLPINGQRYRVSNIVPPGQQGSAACRFRLTDTGEYRVIRTRTHGAALPDIVGTFVPAGSVAADFRVRYTLTHTGGSVVGQAANTAPVFSAIGATTDVTVSVGPSGPSSGTRNSFDTILIEIQRIATGALVSSTTIYFETETDGSA
ncbi:hypothetical protein [Pseudoxanthomonas sp. PXM02]|uniref:hypothetical protein n=1 Tax=Pseudoxanthomonas sp. PXM02 TaxID=2769294 RepID=UPI001786BE93|nr:hypothetical protein [Pseudoxanthomonas sp. PXM02]MBD9478521.1 hypothetical protein [Pseudoxanthomonas sp. PXM02]